MEADQSAQIHSHAQWILQPQTCEQKYCLDETGHPFVSFPVQLFVAASASWHSVLY